MGPSFRPHTTTSALTPSVKRMAIIAPYNFGAFIGLREDGEAYVVSDDLPQDHKARAIGGQLHVSNVRRRPQHSSTRPSFPDKG